MLNIGAPWIYFIIFFGKVTEVSISTLRQVLINRGERVKGSIIAFFDIFLWLIITGTVLSGFQDDVFKSLTFALAFAAGTFMGSWMESKLAIGLCSIQVIIPDNEIADHLADDLRKKDFALTTIQGKGMDGERELLILHTKRKLVEDAINIIKSRMENAVIVVNDTQIVRGGFIKK